MILKDVIGNMGKLLIYFLLLVVIFLSACHTPRYIYAPAIPNNPYFEEKGDLKFSAFYVGMGRMDKGRQIQDGYDIQGAFALSNHWALTAGLFKRKEKDTYFLFQDSRYNIFDSSVVNYKRNLFEFGGGYFTPVNRSKNVFFTLYSGVSFGKFSIDDKGVDTGTAYSRFHKSKIFKWYIQSGLNIITGEYFRFSLLGRISSVHYSNLSNSYNDKEINYFRLYKISDGWLGFFEPSINMQASIPKCNWLKIEGGLTLCSDPMGNYLEARSINPYIGLSFDFSKKNKRMRFGWKRGKL